MLNDAVAYRFEESCLFRSSHNGYYVKLTFPIQRMTLAVLATLSISAWPMSTAPLLLPMARSFHVHEKGDCSAPDATSAGC